MCLRHRTAHSLLGANHHQFKIFRSKGVVLVMFWCFVALFAVQFIAQSSDIEALPTNNVLDPSVISIMCIYALLFDPIGWLADVKFGRYQIVRWGLRTIWVMSILFCLVSVTCTLNLLH